MLKMHVRSYARGRLWNKYWGHLRDWNCSQAVPVCAGTGVTGDATDSYKMKQTPALHVLAEVEHSVPSRAGQARLAQPRQKTANKQFNFLKKSTPNPSYSLNSNID